MRIRDSRSISSVYPGFLDRPMKIFVFICALFVTASTYAQSFDEYKRTAQSELHQYKSDKEIEFRAYRDRINAEFAEYMRQAWQEYSSRPGEPAPDSPKPPDPVIKDPATEPSDDPLPFNEVIPAAKPVTPPGPAIPLPKQRISPPSPYRPDFSFSFYGQKCTMPLENKHMYKLAGATENAFADGWLVLSSDEYLPVLARCLDYRDKLRLCDWGYVRFVEKMTTAFFPEDRINEARLMQMYILTHSGYKVRMARTGNRLVLLLPSDDTIYNYSYLNVGGSKYYIMDKSLKQGEFYVLNQEFPNERNFSLRLAELPAISSEASEPRRLQSKHDKNLVAEVSIDKGLMEFYNDYPLSSNWDIYSNASLSLQAKEQLYPALRSSIAGKDKPGAANILLHFVQTAFDYATDNEQFGTERPLFADETLFYPYSDCEDRAILYSILVRDLLGLDVVLLHYPGHLATAVCFDAELPGDYLQIGNKRYTVCDPTYINADIGESMPKFKLIPAQVITTGQ